MEAKHTQGEWEAWGNKASKFGVTGPAAANAFVAIRALEKDDWAQKGTYVQLASSTKVCPGIALGDTVEEAQANGQLMSAAPDLLAALQGVLRVADRATDEFDAARAAIAKALGIKQEAV